jgi:hypothetical protein
LRKLCYLAALLLTLGIASTAYAEDPEFVYETVVPGYYLSSGRDVAVDTYGNAYVIGCWYEDQQHLDIVVIKLDPEGAPVWEVPIVADELEHDFAADITLDSQENIWIVGWTSSESFPTTPDAMDNTLTGFTDAFLMKLDSEDGDILYSTYLGGDYVDRGEGIFLNDDDEIYITGSTGSTDFPTTPDAYQDEPSAPLYIYEDAFITKLSADGTTILYSTYFGGYEDDAAKHVALDDEGDIVFSGITTADDFPLVNPIQSSPNSIFVSKLSADGTELLFSTYLGGEDLDGLRGMALDSQGHVYITGSTRSIFFPTTPGAFEENFVGEIDGCEEDFPPRDVNCYDGYVTKLATDGSGLMYSTFLGGSFDDHGTDIIVDDIGCAYVIGYTASLDFPGGEGISGAIFVSKFRADGSDLIYTLMKDSNTPGAGHGIALGEVGHIYFTGAVNAPADIYVAKITDGSPIGVPGDISGIPSLGPNVPNPFTHSTQLDYVVPDGGSAHAFLGVYDATGRAVRTLVNGTRPPGTHSVIWDGTNQAGDGVPAGVYFYKLYMKGMQRTGRMLVVR